MDNPGFSSGERLRLKKPPCHLVLLIAQAFVLLILTIAAAASTSSPAVAAAGVAALFIVWAIVATIRAPQNQGTYYLNAALIFVLIIASASSVFSSLTPDPKQISPEMTASLLAASVLGVIVWILFAWRYVFTRESRAYFGLAEPESQMPSRPGKQPRKTDDESNDSSDNQHIRY